MLTLFQALRPGDHIVSSDDMYFGIRVQLNEFFAPWGLETTYVDMSDLSGSPRRHAPGYQVGHPGIAHQSADPPG